MSDVVTVDDLEFDKVHYSSTPTAFWDTYVPENAADVWDGELHRASTPGLSATLSFTGSQVSVFGRVEPASNNGQQPLSLYSVGSQKLQAFIPEDVTSPVDNLAFFNSSVMPYAQYTLVINVSRVDAGTPYLLDYIRFNTSNPDTGASNSGQSSTTTSTAAMSETGTPGSLGVSSASPSTPVGPIVGGIIGGVAVLAVIIFAFLCHRIRKRRARLEPFHSNESKRLSPSAHITPYVLPDHAASQSLLEDAPDRSYTPVPRTSTVSPSMRQLGSTHSLGFASGSPSGKAALARAHHQQQQQQRLAASAGPSGYEHGYDSVHDFSASTTIGMGGVSAQGSGSSGSAAGSHPSHPSSHPNSHSQSYANSNHSPHSTLRDLPPASPHARGKGARPRPSSQQPHPQMQTRTQPQDSGLRFEPGITPSDVAPVLPVAAGPIRSAGTASEVARADIPPAYTPD
ncbi:hypothetical protein C8Q74DRAFT_1277409 [Fomes fomentarius]|nr:hypothetical protein C8Q74DRAFT_1277409 [Fomes fomentarius]